jgi:hypothetical protein
MPFITLTPRRLAAASTVFLVAWPAAAWCANTYEWPGLAGTVRTWGWILTFLLGLVWLIWYTERTGQRRERERTETKTKPDPWEANPFDPAAWYYGKKSQRLRQTFVLLFGYCWCFLLVIFLSSLGRGGGDDLPPSDDLPAGGGGDQAPAARAVKIKQVTRKKFVINPYSSILFSVPSIETVNVKMLETSQHQYTVGYGSGTGTGGGIGRGTGKGAGFGQGTGDGKVGLFRLKHSDRSWDKNFGIGGDGNMLVQYKLLTQMKVAEKPEVLEIGQLNRYTPSKTPPLVIVTGVNSFQLTAAEKKLLKQYLLEKSGMILGDNLGGGSFHNQFIQTMREVTGVQEVPIPRDDYIHRSPFLLPTLPIVVAHGGTIPLGWKVDGRWVAYYHPGALTDAWRDDHAGIKRDVWESCYLLGSNIIYYALSEKDKWLEAQRK